VFPVCTGYKPITFATIVAAMPANYKVKVASVVPPVWNNSSIMHPVAAVFSGITNPIDYLASNQSSVMPGEGDSDSVSTSPVYSVAAVIDPVNAPSLRDPVTGVSAPFSVPHFVWRAAAASDSGLIEFDCLVDNGLIRDTLVDELALTR